MYIHLGMQKTGSKAIQVAMKQNTVALTAHGFIYPDGLSTGMWHRDLFDAFSDPSRKSLDQLAAQDKEVILSYEDAYLADEGVIENVTKRFKDIQLLLFTRHPVGWLNSFKNQLLKGHRRRSPSFLSFNVCGDRWKNSLQLDKHIARWREHADIGSLTLKNYDSMSEVRKEFIDWLGLSGVADTFALSKGNPNKALDAESIRVLLELKKKIADKPIDEHIAIIQRAHELTSANWTDTRTAQGIVLLTKEEIMRINEEMLPILNGALERLGSSYTYDALDISSANMETFDFTPTEYSSKLVADILETRRT